MSVGFNRVILIGNLTFDPKELRTTNNGTQVTDFRIAVNEPGKKDGKTLFVDVTVFGKTAENCAKYLRKGRGALVEGRLDEPDVWTDRNGATRVNLKITANTVTFMPERGGGGGEPREAEPEKEQASPF